MVETHQPETVCKAIALQGRGWVQKLSQKGNPLSIDKHNGTYFTHLHAMAIIVRGKVPEIAGFCKAQVVSSPNMRYLRNWEVLLFQ